MKHIKHIFFDLDHTLWDFDKNSGLTFKLIFEKFNVDLSLNDFLAIYVPINAKYWRLYRTNQISKEDLRYARLDEAFKYLNYAANSQLVIDLSEAYIEHLADFNHLFPYTMEVLDDLEKNYHLHIITNGFKSIQNRKMRSSQIHSYFKTITTSEDVGVKKPDPAIFEHALTKANATTQESLMIGDNLEADILGAQNFGMNTIFFGKDDTFGGQSIQCLSELKTILNT